jgi:hypothetical protein
MAKRKSEIDVINGSIPRVGRGIGVAGAGERGDHRPRPRARAPAPMLVLTNDEVARLLSIEDCMAALEPMYRDLANGQTLLSPRVDNIAPTAHPGGYYGFKHMGGTWPARKIQALRINSDVVTHPLVAGKPRRSSSRSPGT